MFINLNRASGYVKLDVVVRAYDTMNNVVDYAVLLSNGKITWQNGSTDMGVGTEREARLIYEDLDSVNHEQVEITSDED